MKKILVTGGCGYIGSAIYNNLKDKYIVDTVDLEWFGNYTNPNNIKKDFDELSQEFLNNYDVIVHVAANSSVPLCKDIFDSFDNNVTKFINLVKKLKKQKFIYASSSCVYGTTDQVPKVENETILPIDGLTLSKTTIDNLMPLLDIEYYGLRFGSVNGWSPNMRLDLMINSMTISALRDKSVNVFNGHAYRPIISTKDLSRAVEAIIDFPSDARGIYNAASFNENIYHIGSKVAEYINVPLNDRGKNFTYDFTVSSEKFEKTFNFKFDETVETIVKSILDNPFNDGWGKREIKK